MTNQEDLLTPSVNETLSQLQTALKKLELWSRSDLTIIQIQRLCAELDMQTEGAEE